MPILLQRSALLLGPNLGYLSLMAPAQTLRASWTTCHILCEKWAQILGEKKITLENILQILNAFFFFFCNTNGKCPVLPEKPTTAQELLTSVLSPRISFCHTLSRKILQHIVHYKRDL